MRSWRSVAREKTQSGLGEAQKPEARSERETRQRVGQSERDTQGSMGEAQEREARSERETRPSEGQSERKKRREQRGEGAQRSIVSGARNKWRGAGEGAEAQSEREGAPIMRRRPADSWVWVRLSVTTRSGRSKGRGRIQSQYARTPSSALPNASAPSPPNRRPAALKRGEHSPARASTHILAHTREGESAQSRTYKRRRSPTHIHAHAHTYKPYLP